VVGGIPGAIDSLPGLIYAAPGVFTRVEGFPQQVALQWWGNTVSPASFHDLWLQDGFANFSAALYDLTARPDLFRTHWQQAQDGLVGRPALPL